MPINQLNLSKPYQVRKIQILASKNDNHPLFYCHSADVGHSPEIVLESKQNQVILRARSMLYKVKINPQSKTRIDIYMSIEQANELGEALMGASGCHTSAPLQDSKARPDANASGNMRLPNIVWSKYCTHAGVKAKIDSGLYFPFKEAGSIYIDLEYPDDTHIKMTEHEIHMGVDLSSPQGRHNPLDATLVDVPPSELQRGRNEQNPIPKVQGHIVLVLAASIARGLGMV